MFSEYKKLNETKEQKQKLYSETPFGVLFAHCILSNFLNDYFLKHTSQYFNELLFGKI